MFRSALGRDGSETIGHRTLVLYLIESSVFQEQPDEYRYNIIQVAVLLSFGFSSGWVGLRSDSPKAVEPVVLSSDIQETLLDFQFEGYHMLEVQTPNGTEHVIDLVGGSSILDAGFPDLDKWTSSIIIPDQGTTSIEVISSSYHEYSDITVAPSKGNFSQISRLIMLFAL